MAKRRRKMTAKQLKYFGPKGAKVAKRKRRRRSKSVVRVSRRRAPARRRRARHHGGGGGGGGGSIMPNRIEVEGYVASVAYGFLESKAVAEPGFLLNSIPRPIAQLGYAGGTALALRIANKLFLKNKYVGLLANAAAHAAMYQIGRSGKLFTAAAAPATVSGDEGYLGDDDSIGDYLDGNTLGALDAEGTVGDYDENMHVGGVPYMEPNPGT